MSLVLYTKLHNWNKKKMIDFWKLADETFESFFLLQLDNNDRSSAETFQNAFIKRA